MKSLTLISLIILIILSSINAQGVQSSSKAIPNIATVKIPTCLTTKQVSGICNKAQTATVYTFSGKENGNACTYTTKCPGNVAITTTTTTTNTLPTKVPKCQATKQVNLCAGATTAGAQVFTLQENGKPCTISTKCVASSPITTTTTTTTNTLPTKVPKCQSTKQANLCAAATTAGAQVFTLQENGKPCTISTKCVASSPITTTTTTTTINTLPTKVPKCQTTKQALDLCKTATAAGAQTITLQENGKPCTITTKCVASNPITTTTTTTTINTLPTKVPKCQTTKQALDLCKNATTAGAQTLTLQENGKPCTVTTKCVITNPITTTTTTTTLPSKVPQCKTTKQALDLCKNATTAGNQTITLQESGKPCTITTKCVPSNPVTTTTTITTLPTKCIPETVYVTVTETVTVTVKADNPQSNCAAKYAQCGGQGFNGPTCCQSGSTCQRLNDYYSQCV